MTDQSESESNPKESSMDRPDLAELVRETEQIIESITGLNERFAVAESAALGEDDDEGHTIRPGNGDQWETYQSACEIAAGARFELGKIVELLATQEGYRHFAAAGVTRGTT